MYSILHNDAFWLHGCMSNSYMLRVICCMHKGSILHPIQRSDGLGKHRIKVHVASIKHEALYDHLVQHPENMVANKFV